MSTENTYNGWTNYATWRVNLEICDDICASHLDSDRSFSSVYELSKSLQEDAELIVSGYEEFPESLTLDYARAFLSDVNWYEIASHWTEELIEAEEEEEEEEDTEEVA